LLYNVKYNSLSDDELLTSYMSSDDKTYVGVLYNRYGHLVLGLCIKYLKNKDDAQDAVIQIFADLLNDLKKHKITYFKSWLYVYSKNYCLMQLRKRQSTLKKDMELRDNYDLFVESDDPEHLNEKERQITMLENAIGELNDLQKQCVTLFYLHNKSYNEISGITGMTINEVKSHLQNGKRNLKIRMEALLNEQTGKT
jgi:RNA polymerase sigma factor (sigma-70 family)